MTTAPEAKEASEAKADREYGVATLLEIKGTTAARQTNSSAVLRGRPTAKFSASHKWQLDQQRRYKSTDTQFPDSLDANFEVIIGSLAARKDRVDRPIRLARGAATRASPRLVQLSPESTSAPAALNFLSAMMSFSGDPSRWYRPPPSTSIHGKTGRIPRPSGHPGRASQNQHRCHQ